MKNLAELKNWELLKKTRGISSFEPSQSYLDIMTLKQNFKEIQQNYFQYSQLFDLKALYALYSKKISFNDGILDL